MRKILFLLSILGGLFAATQSYANSCNQAVPVCTASGYQFQAVATSTTAEPGNSYSCLSTQPDPQWFYLAIATSGDVTLQMQAGSDIDFILYGPYSNQTAAFADCGNLGSSASEIVGCSYSTSGTETVTITGAVAGEYYIGVITNYAGVDQTVTVSQTGGSGGTDCSIVGLPTCTDGIQNGDETGVDCGGTSCAPCATGCSANNGSW